MHVYTILYPKPLYFLLPLSRKRLMGYCCHPSRCCFKSLLDVGAAQVHIKGQGDDLGGFFYLNKDIPTLNCCVFKKSPLQEIESVTFVLKNRNVSWFRRV